MRNFTNYCELIHKLLWNNSQRLWNNSQRLWEISRRLWETSQSHMNSWIYEHIIICEKIHKDCEKNHKKSMNQKFCEKIHKVCEHFHKLTGVFICEKIHNLCEKNHNCKW